MDKKKEFLTERITVRFTNSEIESINKNAEKVGCVRGGKVCPSKYIRKLVLDREKDIIVINDLKPLVKEVNHIGNNLNQLTKLSHMGKLNTVYLIEMQNEIQAIRQEIALIYKEVQNGSYQNDTEKRE